MSSSASSPAQSVQPRPWDVHRLPRSEGRTFLVTGGNAGIGHLAAEPLAGTGAAKSAFAQAATRARVPGSHVRHRRLDLAGLQSTRAASLLLRGNQATAWDRHRGPDRPRPEDESQVSGPGCVSQLGTYAPELSPSSWATFAPAALACVTVRRGPATAAAGAVPAAGRMSPA